MRDNRRDSYWNSQTRILNCFHHDDSYSETCLYTSVSYRLNTDMQIYIYIHIWTWLTTQVLKEEAEAMFVCTAITVLKWRMNRGQSYRRERWKYYKLLDSPKKIRKFKVMMISLNTHLEQQPKSQFLTISFSILLYYIMYDFSSLKRLQTVGLLLGRDRERVSESGCW